tara:strand:+ start:3596 stop:4084 length:489 start_codon:yes stop_codon:yes gene_type:complete
MKKRTAAIAAVVSLLPMGEPLVIGTGAVLTSAAVIFSVPEYAKGESAEFYFNRGFQKSKDDDYYGAISEYSKAIRTNPMYWDAYFFRAVEKIMAKDYTGAISDLNKIIDENPTYGYVSNGKTHSTRGWAKYFSGNRNDGCADWREGLRKGRTSAAEWIRAYC